MAAIISLINQFNYICICFISFLKNVACLAFQKFVLRHFAFAKDKRYSRFLRYFALNERRALPPVSLIFEDLHCAILLLRKTSIIVGFFDLRRFPLKPFCIYVRYALLSPVFKKSPHFF